MTENHSRRLSVEAAEALAAVLLEDARCDRRARLGTIAMNRRMLMPRFGMATWFGMPPLSPVTGVFARHQGVFSASETMYPVVPPARAAGSFEETAGDGCVMRGDGYGCLWGDWHERHRWHEMSLCSFDAGHGFMLASCLSQSTFPWDGTQATYGSCCPSDDWCH